MLNNEKCPSCGAPHNAGDTECSYCGKNLRQNNLNARQNNLNARQNNLNARQNNLNTRLSNPTLQPTPVRTNASAAPKKSGPSIPTGNRFAAHEQLISRIARRAAQSCAKWIRNQEEWKPINNGYSSHYDVEITVNYNGVAFNKLASVVNLNSIWFSSYEMSDIPEAQTEAFLDALKPFLDVYFPEEIEKAFSDVSALIQRSTSVTFGKYLDSIDFDGRNYYKKSICVSMCYTYPPAPKLKSW